MYFNKSPWPFPDKPDMAFYTELLNDGADKQNFNQAGV